MPEKNSTGRDRARATPALKMAIAEARRGNAVVAMKAGTKLPIEEWVHGKRGPIDWRDPDTLRAEWPRGQSAVGALTGPSNLVVMDIDPPDGEASLADLLARAGRGHRIPATRTLATPRGGYQLIFAAPPDREFKTCAGIEPGIDIRGRGGLIKIWDPTEPERRITDDRDPVEIPKWLADFLPEPGTPSASADVNGEAPGLDIERLVRDGVKPGRQEDVLKSLVWKLSADGVGRDGTYAIWSAILANSVTGVDATGEPRPPWTRADFDAKWGGAEAKLAPVRSELNGFRDIKPLRPGARRRLDKMRSAAWLDEQVLPPIQFAVPTLLAEGLTLLAGPPKSGKSLLVLRFGLEVARGGEVFGQKCEAREVLYLALEDGLRRIQTRGRELLGNDPKPTRLHYITEDEPGELILLVRDFLDEYPSGMAIVDVLSKVMEKAQRGETTYDRDYRITGYLKKEADRHPGAVVVVNTHSRKAKADDFVEMVSGTQGISGAADTIILLVRKRGEMEGLLKIAGRDVDDAEYALSIERPTGWRLDGDDLLEAAGNATNRQSMLNEKIGPRSLAVIEFVNDHPEGVSIAQVATATGLIPRDAKTYLHSNYEGGRIEKAGRGVYVPVSKAHLGGKT